MRYAFALLVLAICISTGNGQSIGIGTNSPNTSAILDVNSSTKGLLFPRTSTSTRLSMTGVKGLMVYDTTLSQFFYHTGAAWTQVASGPPPTNYWSPFGVNIFSNVSGNVGIGVSVPPYKLSVNGDAYITSDAPTIRLIGSTNAFYAQIRMSLYNQNPNFNITQALSNLYISRNTGTFGFVNDFVISEDGFVGIGSSNPDTRLQIEGGTDVGPASGGYLQIGNSSSNNVGFDNNEIQARNNGASSRLVLQNDAGPLQIGNGITPAGYKVSVTGKMICEELKIQDVADWPDYVFGDAYPLTSLDELRNFIETHRHLPGIPSAGEMATSGLIVGDMQTRMMTKIEELTLYILQLEESQHKLENEIAQLK